VEVRAFEGADAAVVFGDSFRLEVVGQVLLCRSGGRGKCARAEFICRKSIEGCGPESAAGRLVPYSFVLNPPSDHVRI
jgi:hypothetical protein